LRSQDPARPPEHRTSRGVAYYCGLPRRLAAVVHDGEGRTRDASRLRTLRVVKLDRARHIAALAAASVDGAGSAERDAATAKLLDDAEAVPAALRVLIAADPSAALDMAGCLSAFWQDAGEVDIGRELTAEAIQAADGIEDRGPVARAVLVAADLAFRQGDQTRAGELAREAIELATMADDSRTAALAWLDLARVAFRDADASGIESAALAAERIAPDDPVVRRGVIHMLAWAAYTAGDVDEARRRFLASLEVRRAQGSRIGVASELSNLGDLAMEAGDVRAAGRYLAEAWQVGVELGSDYLLVNILPSLAVLAATSDVDRAARLFGAADALARTSGLAPDPGAGHPEERAALRARLGAERFDALEAEGRALSREEMTALAGRWPEADEP